MVVGITEVQNLGENIHNLQLNYYFEIMSTTNEWQTFIQRVFPITGTHAKPIPDSQQ